MSDSGHRIEDQSKAPQPRFKSKRTALLAGAAILIIAAGAAGASGNRLVQRWQPQSVMLLQPAPIDKLPEQTPVAVKGEVAEIYGNKFIVQDGSGRALVDLGPRGDNSTSIVTKGEAITVQGRFDRGVIHAQVVQHADGRTEGFGPPKPPRPEHRPPPPPPGADRGPPPPPPGDAPPPPPAAR